jgi:tRNA(Ile)-lysidine synthase
MAAIVAAELDLLDELTAAVWQTVVTEQTADWLELDRAGWQGLALALRRRLLRRAVEQLLPGTEVGFRTLEQARQLAEAEASGLVSVLPGNLRLEVGYERLKLRRESAVLPPHAPQLTQTEPQPLPVPGRVDLAQGWWLETAVVPDPDLALIRANPDPWTAFVDGERAGPLWLRPRRPGERLQPLGLNGRWLKIKTIMINRKIAAGSRARWPLVANAAHPVWLVGHHPDERVKVTAATQLVWRIACRPGQPDSHD